MHNCKRGLDTAGWVLVQTWRREGVPVKEIARRLGCTPKAVRNNFTLLHPSLRQRRKSPVQDTTAQLQRRIYVQRLVKLKGRGHHKRRFPSCAAICRHARSTGLFSVSRTTVRKDLIACGFVAKRRPRAPQRREGDECRRLKFCERALRRKKLFSKLLFSDEKYFDVNDHGSLVEWCFPGDKPLPRRSGRWAPKLHVWGMIGLGVKELVILPKGSLNAAKYIRRCLPRILPYHYRAEVWFQQDGASPHVAHRTAAWLRRKGVPFIDDWPARSPDLNPIENLWALLQRMVSDYGPTEHGQLADFVRRAWNKISQKTVNDLVLSFEGRCRRCVNELGK